MNDDIYIIQTLVNAGVKLDTPSPYNINYLHANNPLGVALHKYHSSGHPVSIEGAAESARFLAKHYAIAGILTVQSLEDHFFDESREYLARLSLISKILRDKGATTQEIVDLDITARDLTAVTEAVSSFIIRDTVAAFEEIPHSPDVKGNISQFLGEDFLTQTPASALNYDYGERRPTNSDKVAERLHSRLDRNSLNFNKRVAYRILKEKIFLGEGEVKTTAEAVVEDVIKPKTIEAVATNAIKSKDRLGFVNKLRNKVGEAAKTGRQHKKPEWVGVNGRVIFEERPSETYGSDILSREKPKGFLTKPRDNSKFKDGMPVQKLSSHNANRHK